MSENKDLGASAADATDRVGGLRPEPQDASQPSGRSPTGAWVSVKDALPSERGPKLVVTNNFNARDRYGNMSHVFLTTMLHKDGDEFCAFADDASMMKIWGVTHWMHILAPEQVS